MNISSSVNSSIWFISAFTISVNWSWISPIATFCLWPDLFSSTSWCLCWTIKRVKCTWRSSESIRWTITFEGISTCEFAVSLIEGNTCNRCLSTKVIISLKTLFSISPLHCIVMTILVAIILSGLLFTVDNLLWIFFDGFIMSTFSSRLPWFFSEVWFSIDFIESSVGSRSSISTYSIIVHLTFSTTAITQNGEALTLLIFLALFMTSVLSVCACSSSSRIMCSCTSVHISISLISTGTSWVDQCWWSPVAAWYFLVNVVISSISRSSTCTFISITVAWSIEMELITFVICCT